MSAKNVNEQFVSEMIKRGVPETRARNFLISGLHYNPDGGNIKPNEVKLGQGQTVDIAKPNESSPDKTPKAKNIPAELFMSWDDLKGKGLMKDIIQKDYTLYCVLYFAEFGAYPGDMFKSKKESWDPNVKAVYEAALREFTRKQLKGMDWPELREKGLTEKLKSLDPDVYKGKYIKEYGVLPTM